MKKWSGGQWYKTFWETHYLLCQSKLVCFSPEIFLLFSQAGRVVAQPAQIRLVSSIFAKVKRVSLLRRSVSCATQNMSSACAMNFFYGCNYLSVQARAFVTDSYFYPSLTFLGKARYLEWSSIKGLHWERPQMLDTRRSTAIDKHPSLLRCVINYACKKFYNNGPWRYFEARKSPPCSTKKKSFDLTSGGHWHKTFYARNYYCAVVS